MRRLTRRGAADRGQYRQAAGAAATAAVLFVSCTIRWAAETTHKGWMEVVLVLLLETAPTPDPALDPDVALDPENAVLDP